MKKTITAVCITVFTAIIAVVFVLNFETADEHYSKTAAKGSVIGTATISVSCEEIAKNENVGERLKASGLVPKDGIIVPETQVTIYEDDTAFSVLKTILDNNRILFDYSDISDTSAYVKGINNIYEYDCGDLSGWMYSVNGIFPTVSSSEYKLSDGDTVVWQYTCDLGRDVGDNYYLSEGVQSDEQ